MKNIRDCHSLRHPQTGRGGFLEMTRGITIVELILSISIIGMFSTLAVISFRSSKQDDLLRIAGFRATDAIRAAQSYALAGIAQNASQDVRTAQFFGVSVQKDSDNVGKIVIFADTNTVSGTGIYDDGKDVKIQELSLDPDGRKTVVLDGITLDRTAHSAPVDIAFKKPDAAGVVNGGVDAQEAVLTFKHMQSGHTRTVTVNRVTGRVDAQF
ncbi:type II secretion system protein [Candidatus Uhrbacteria bacterium]|nr:type II secretion system protein [Candidatus Uhrbacteria bacterium]